MLVMLCVRDVSLETPEHIFFSWECAFQQCSVPKRGGEVQYVGLMNQRQKMPTTFFLPNCLQNNHWEKTETEMPDERWLTAAVPPLPVSWEDCTLPPTDMSQMAQSIHHSNGRRRGEDSV